MRVTMMVDVPEIAGTSVVASTNKTEAKALGLAESQLEYYAEYKSTIPFGTICTPAAAARLSHPSNIAFLDRDRVLDLERVEERAGFIVEGRWVPALARVYVLPNCKLVTGKHVLRSIVSSGKAAIILLVVVYHPDPDMIALCEGLEKGQTLRQRLFRVANVADMLKLYPQLYNLGYEAVAGLLNPYRRQSVKASNVDFKAFFNHHSKAAYAVAQLCAPYTFEQITAEQAAAHPRKREIKTVVADGITEYYCKQRALDQNGAVWSPRDVHGVIKQKVLSALVRVYYHVSSAEFNALGMTLLGKRAVSERYPSHGILPALREWLNRFASASDADEADRYFTVLRTLDGVVNRTLTGSSPLPIVKGGRVKCLPFGVILPFPKDAQHPVCAA